MPILVNVPTMVASRFAAELKLAHRGQRDVLQHDAAVTADGFDDAGPFAGQVAADNGRSGGAAAAEELHGRAIERGEMTPPVFVNTPPCKRRIPPPVARIVPVLTALELLGSTTIVCARKIGVDGSSRLVSFIPLNPSCPPPAMVCDAPVDQLVRGRAVGHAVLAGPARATASRCRTRSSPRAVKVQVGVDVDTRPH